MSDSEKTPEQFISDYLGICTGQMSAKTRAYNIARAWVNHSKVELMTIGDMERIMTLAIEDAEEKARAGSPLVKDLVAHIKELERQIIDGQEAYDNLIARLNQEVVSSKILYTLPSIIKFIEAHFDKYFGRTKEVKQSEVQKETS